MSRKFLVTGATGFIGGNLLGAAVERNIELHCVSRNPSPRDTTAGKSQWHHGDLSDGDWVINTVKAVKPDVIVHLGSLVKGARDNDLLHDMFKANTVSTVNLLEGARLAGVGRVITAGSLEEPIGASETATSPYALSKLGSRIYGGYYNRNTPVDVINLQIFMVYGPAQIDEKKLVPYAIRCALNAEDIELSSGARMVDWVFVEDVVEAIFRCAEIDPVPTVPVPVGTGAAHSVREVVETIKNLTGSRAELRFGALDDRSEEVVRTADTSLTSDLLGWAPTTTLVAGLKATIDWYASHP